MYFMPRSYHSLVVGPLVSLWERPLRGRGFEYPHLTGQKNCIEGLHLCRALGTVKARVYLWCDDPEREGKSLSDFHVFIFLAQQGRQR